MKRLSVIINQLPGIGGSREKAYAAFEPSDFASAPTELRIGSKVFRISDGAFRGVPAIDRVTPATLVLTDGSTLPVELEPLAVQ